MKYILVLFGVAILGAAQPPVPAKPTPVTPKAAQPGPAPTIPKPPAQPTTNDLNDHQQRLVREAQLFVTQMQMQLDAAQSSYRDAMNSFNTVRIEIEKECGGNLRETPATGPDGKPKVGSLACVVTPPAPPAPAPGTPAATPPPTATKPPTPEAKK